MFINQISVLGSFLFVAIALAMDAFSVSLSIGLQNIRLKKIAYIGIVIGVFHIVLPFIGMVIGGMISLRLEQTASLIGALLLIFIGLHLFFSAFTLDKHEKISVTSVKLFALAFVVSIDSFPVGISLGLTGIHMFFVLFLFGATSMMFAWVGMLIGKKAHTHLRKYSEMFGGVILFLAGMFIIF